MNLREANALLEQQQHIYSPHRPRRAPEYTASDGKSGQHITKMGIPQAVPHFADQNKFLTERGL